MQLKSSLAKPFSLLARRARLDKQPTQIANWKQARVIGAARTSDPISGIESVVNTEAEDLRERVMELTGGKGVDVVFDTVGGPLFEPALRSLGIGGRQVAISSAGGARVSFSLVDFYHNLSRLIGVDSYGLTPRQVAEIEDELRPGFETGVLKPPPIEIVPFEKALDAYSGCHGAGNSETGPQLQLRIGAEGILSVTERVEMPRRDPCYRLEHCTVVHPSAIARMRSAGRPMSLIENPHRADHGGLPLDRRIVGVKRVADDRLCRLPSSGRADHKKRWSAPLKSKLAQSPRPGID
jgi:hypothetical protein